MKRNVIIKVKKKIDSDKYSYFNNNDNLSDLEAIDEDIKIVKEEIDRLNKVNSLLVERRKDLKELETLRRLYIEREKANNE